MPEGADEFKMGISLRPEVNGQDCTWVLEPPAANSAGMSGDSVISLYPQLVIPPDDSRGLVP